MSWQLASLALLGIALAAGFAWYEREKPPARVLAVVAALAALAVVGRLAFAAFPNVKPTTDIVLFAGYALGAIPGFAVGAVTAIVSNIFLSQGPWTVWQMAGWGAVGVGGALLARVLHGREPNRFVLAAVCGLAGLLFGAWMDVYQWTFAARQDLDSYIAVATISLPYNVAHAVGNVVFCLLIGPAFLRALARYRRRLEVRWERSPAPIVAGAMALALLLAVPAAASAATPASRAESYLLRAQNKDGGFGTAPQGELEPALHRLGGPGARLRGAQPPRREAQRRALAGVLRAARQRLAQGHRRDRADGAARAGGRHGPAPLRGPQPARRDREAPARRRLDLRIRELHGLRRDGAAGVRRLGGVRDDPVARVLAERRRRLRGRALLGERLRHDRRGAAGAGNRGARPRPRRRSAPPSGCATTRTATAASGSSRGATRTRSRPRTRSRGCWPRVPAGTPPRARGHISCASSAATAASPTRPRAPRRPCG